MKNNSENVLNEEFLCELYNCAITNNQICSAVCQYMKDEYLPDKQYQMLNNALKDYFNAYKSAPQYGIMMQTLSASKAVSELLREIRTMASGVEMEAVRDQFETYLKLANVQKIRAEIDEAYKRGERLEAIRMFEARAKALASFSLAPERFVEIKDTLEARLMENKIKQEGEAGKALVNSFYIDGLDNLNHGQNLRTQLTVFLAMSGVGKSHLIRWIGFNGAYVSGLNVLQFQLEGSAAEVYNAYSAQLLGMETVQYEQGEADVAALKEFRKQIEKYSGTLRVRAYSKFGQKPTTTDIRNEIEEYKKEFGYYPDIILVDSLDLLGGSVVRKSNSTKDIRFERVECAQDLKDMAGEVDAWIVATYQSTIENKDWVNDEKNVLDRYNISEAKGLVRPLTHFITLNQSDTEADEQTMRIFADKMRFTKRGQQYPRLFRICTDYEHENFYDRTRSLNLTNG